MTVKDRLAPLLREPLVHFLAAGVCVFAFSQWRGEPADLSSRSITIAEADVARLASDWERTWQRAPSSTELDAIIRDSVREEIYYREAVRLGLDKNDPLVRKRMRAKMEAIARAAAESDTPSDDDLKPLLSKLATPQMLSFEQIYLGTADPATALAKLKSGSRPMTVGNPIDLPPTLTNTAADEIDRRFGTGFAAAIVKLPQGQWAGPVQSGFGLHLIRLNSVTMPKLKLDDVRQQLENDWRAANGNKRAEAAYQALLDGYTIKIAKPE